MVESVCPCSALSLHNRYHPSAQDQHSALSILRTLVRRRMDSAIGSFARLLGAPIDSMLDSVVERLESSGRSLTIKGVAPVEATRLTITMALEAFVTAPSGDLVVIDGTPFLLLRPATTAAAPSTDPVSKPVFLCISLVFLNLSLRTDLTVCGYCLKKSLSVGTV